MHRISCCHTRSLPVNSGCLALPIPSETAKDKGYGGIWSAEVGSAQWLTGYLSGWWKSGEKLWKRLFDFIAFSPYPVSCLQRALTGFMELACHVSWKKEKVEESERKPKESIKNCLCYLINLLQQIIHAKLGLAKSPKNNIFFCEVLTN